jgi:hypothetical protein
VRADQPARGPLRRHQASSFVVVFSIEHISKGPYGTELRASLSKDLGEWGYLDRIKLAQRRKYPYRGRELSYFNAGCPAPGKTNGSNSPSPTSNSPSPGGNLWGRPCRRPAR